MTVRLSRTHHLSSADVDPEHPDPGTPRREQEVRELLLELKRTARQAREVRAHIKSDEFKTRDSATQRQLRRERRLRTRRAARLVQDALNLGVPARLISQTVEPDPSEER